MSHQMSYEVWQGLPQLRKKKKMTMLLSAQGIQTKPPKGTNPNHANKGDEVENGGNHLITGHWWGPLTNERETAINENGPQGT